MLTKNKIVIVLFCIFIFTAGIFIWHKTKMAVVPAPQKLENSQTKKGQSVDETVSEATKTYTDSTLDFSFNYPYNFKLKASAEGDQDSITVNGEDGKNGFQILIGAYGEKDQLSLATIKNDAGELTMADGKEISLGQKNEIQAFSFTLTNPDADAGDISATLDEVWFVRDGKLYQISSYADFSQNMGKILQSFRFN